MAFSALKYVCLCLVLLLTLMSSSGLACFGPKLFIGVAAGQEGEMRFYLVSIYLHEKTGIDSTLIELKSGQTGAEALAAKEIDLGFSSQPGVQATPVLHLGGQLYLYSGERPLNDLQFSTVGRTLVKLQQRLDTGGLESIRQKIQTGTLPAVAVRDFLLKNGWI
ncbi:hypothetical protein [Geopsychrobacter electrodiphilus]|uniref:hypothetical protein n=1 Tax=Geopsychrobacter electrodiphilus TaxID=225196 RepID=UPI000363B5E0|nr:hypothetical protein [Geopsychrobacter electrodiphilus]